jgi:uroporphyrinogen-III decarboxylase
LNLKGYGYREYFNEPAVTLEVQSCFQEYIAATLSRTCDMSSILPEYWNFSVENQNIYDAAYFGAEINFEDGQVPCAHQFLTMDDVDNFMSRDFSCPLENDWIKNRLAFHGELVRKAGSFSYLGRKGRAAPFGVGFDGPLTVATNLFGEDICMLMGLDPEKAKALLLLITRACILRNKALADLAGGWKKGEFFGLADDSIQLISTDMYREMVLPAHELWFDEMSFPIKEGGIRSMHLCGDATRHFKFIHDQLGVTSFDTGFPVDHGRLRRELGPGVEISGGPRIDILRDGTPQKCLDAARGILQSGVMEGGRFILQEGNNLPPCVPLANLEAVYSSCIQYGRF